MVLPILRFSNLLQCCGLASTLRAVQCRKGQGTGEGRARLEHAFQMRHGGL